MKVDDSSELYESIPWDALVTDDVHKRRRWMYVAAAAIVLGALTAAIVGNLPASGPNGPDAAPVEQPVAPIAADTIDGSDTPPLREADLRTGPADAADTAAAVAAWFVADYFTLDGSAAARESLSQLLPSDVELPDPDAAARSFVESVSAHRVEAVGSDRFRVSMIVRTLAAVDGEAYVREPARAVELVVQVAETGVAVVDLPRPAPLPDIDGRELALESSPAPEAVVDGAEEVAGQWGLVVGEPLSTGSVDGVWRVVTMVQTPAGLTWPMAVWLDESGGVVDPP